MACKFCNKNVYYDTTWYHSDGGYGDNDYGGIDVNQIAVRVCPNCGEIRVPEKFKEDEKAKNEFILNTLASMLVNNVKNMNIVGEDKIRETIDKILRLSDSKYSDKLLEKNGWYSKRNGGNHELYTNGNNIEPIPRHPKINERLARDIIKNIILNRKMRKDNERKKCISNYYYKRKRWILCEDTRL